MRQDVYSRGTSNSASAQSYVYPLLHEKQLIFFFLLDAGAFKFTCRVDPRCGKKFVRGDLLARHEERHQNRKNKQGMSEDGHSPPARIAPSPTGSPTSDLANNFTRAINIPMSSPDNDYDYA